MNRFTFHYHKLEIPIHKELDTIPRKKLLYESSNRVLHVLNNNCLQANSGQPNKTKFDARILCIQELVSLKTVTQFFI